MPLYEYTGRDCEHAFETLVFDGDEIECPQCHLPNAECRMPNENPLVFHSAFGIRHSALGLRLPPAD